jgi:hypothetical protein
MASNKADWEKNRIVVFGEPNTQAPNIRALTIRDRRVWRRTDPTGKNQVDAHADYQTLTQAATASAEQHLELAVGQSLRKSPPQRTVTILRQVPRRRRFHS